MTDAVTSPSPMKLAWSPVGSVTSASAASPKPRCVPRRLSDTIVTLARSDRSPIPLVGSGAEPGETTVGDNPVLPSCQTNAGRSAPTATCDPIPQAGHEIRADRVRDDLPGCAQGGERDRLMGV